MRDEFSKPTKKLIAERAAYKCSKPDCRREQIGPGQGVGSVNLGKVAHICAASSGGPRYDTNQTAEQRSSAANGIFLCSGHADLIDKENGKGFSAELLREWKKSHEELVYQNLDKSPEDAEKFKKVTWNESGTVGAQIENADIVTINVGVSIKDAMEIAREVFENSFQKLSTEAFATATDRAEEISEKFVERIRDESEKLLDSIKDPAIQKALYEAQKNYAHSGKPEFRDILVELLVERCTGDDPDFFTTQISQAISVTDKLTTEMLHTMSMAAVVRYGIRPINGQPVKDYLEILVESIFQKANFYDRDCQALVAAGCLVASSGHIHFSSLLLLNSFFTRTFPELFEGLPEVPPDRVKNIITDLCPSFAPVFEYWNKSMLTYSGITKVGAAIGVSNLKAVTGISPPLREIIES